MSKDLQDKFSWMRDSNWPNVSDSRVIEHLNSENKKVEEYFSTPAVAGIKQELEDRIKIDKYTEQIEKGEYTYYSALYSEKDYYTYYRKSNNSAPEVILDINLLAKDHQFFNIGSIAISPCNSYIAYTYETSGDEKYKLVAIEISSGKKLDWFNAENISSDIIWSNNSEMIFGCYLNKEHRPYQLAAFTNSDSKLIYEEKEAHIVLHIGKSSDKKYLFMNRSDHDANELYYYCLSGKSDILKLLIPLEKNKKYNANHRENTFFIRSNHISENFSLFCIKEDSAQRGQDSYSKDDMEVFISQQDRYLESFDITNGYIILNYKHKGLMQIEVMNLSNKQINYISFADEVYEAYGYSTNYEKNDIRISYSSPITPLTKLSYDFVKDRKKVILQNKIGGEFDGEKYVVKRLWAKNDGVEIPITFIYSKEHGCKNMPLYLKGYGSYGISYPVSFNFSILSLLDSGICCAIAHVRGGSEMGRPWYLDGKFLKKKNTFLDFTKVVEHLIDSGYTDSNKIAISGGSAGGLLMGAAININPKLYKAVIAHVPFVDVLATMLDETLPLTPGEYNEWGNPNEKEYYDYMKSYCPYTNLKQCNYPNILATCGLSDIRVGYWEAAKWISKINELNTGNSDILLKINMSFGHSGASGKFDYLEEIAQEIYFVKKYLT